MLVKLKSNYFNFEKKNYKKKALAMKIKIKQNGSPGNPTLPEPFNLNTHI